MYVVTDAATGVWDGGFLMNAHFVEDEGDPDTDRCGFEYRISGGENIWKDMTGAYGPVSPYDGHPSPELTVLPNKTYYFRAWLKDENEVYYYGSWLSLTTTHVMTAETKPTDWVAATSALLVGWIVDPPGALWPDACGFEWKKGVGGEISRKTLGGPGTQDFLWPISSLDEDTIYYYRAFVWDQLYEDAGLGNEGRIYGNWLRFTTEFNSFVVTHEATNIGNIVATINGETVPGIDGPVTESGFWWKEVGKYYWQKEKILEKSGIYDYTIISTSLFLGSNAFDNKTFTGGIGDWDDLTGGLLESVSGAGRYTVGASPSKDLLELNGAGGTVLRNLVVAEGSRYRMTIYGRIDSNWSGGTITIYCSGQSYTLAVQIIKSVKTTFDIYPVETDPAITIKCAEVPTQGDIFYIDTIELVPYFKLEPNKSYVFKAYGKTAERTFYGEELGFTTTNIVPSVTTQIATDLEALSVTGNGTIVGCGGLEGFCKTRGFDVKYEFSGNLKEYDVWVGYGFTGDITFNDVTGRWEGTIVKQVEVDGIFPAGVFASTITGLVNDKEYEYCVKAENEAGWGYGSYKAFTTDDLLLRKICTRGIFTIMLCAYVKPIPSGSVIKRRGFRWGTYNSAQEYDIHEDGDFSASATIGPVDTISFVCSNDDNVYDTIVDSAGGFLTAGFEAGKFIDVSATGAINPANEGKFKIISVTANTITVNVRNTLVSEAVDGVTIVELYALYIVDLEPETSYFSVAYVAIEDSEGNWTVQEGNVTETITITNIFDFEGYDKVEFYKPEREQNYRKITRKIEEEIIANQQYIDKVGGRRVLDINNHLIQSRPNAILIGTDYKDTFKNIKSKMDVEYPTPAPFQREDTLDIGFGRIRFKEDDKGVVNFMPDGEGLMLFRYRMVMVIRKINMGYIVSKDSVDYIATMELEEA